MRRTLTLVKSLLQRSLLLLLATITATTSLNAVATQQVAALSGGDFNPGFIISDSTFYNGYRMSSVDIQAWLNAQVPVCDTNGSQQSTHYYSAQNRYYSRAEWGAVNGNPAPYTCLKDFQADVGTIGADPYCGAIGGGRKSAATMIADVSQACGVNPQVLLVLLQKEQGLVTDDWPWQSQYRAATGYACPDTAACDTTYAGLYNQIYWAARQFQYYHSNPNVFNYRAGRSQYIQYNPNSSCGGTQILIQNQATAGLYNYTPYQPNAAALGNLYGTGDSCSAYGNRNFWRMFNSWFGNSTADCSNDSSSPTIVRLYDPRTFNHYYSTNYCEMNNLVKLYGYIYEGPAFTQVSPSATNAVPVFRLYNKTTNLHFYTTSQADIDQATRYAGFTYEGPAFYMLSNGAPNAYPVYRLYNPRTFIHMWTTSTSDIDQATRYAGYVLEGPTFSAP